VDILKEILPKPIQGTDYNICGKSSICDYCDAIGYNDTGKCGKTKIRRHGLYNDIAIDKASNEIH
jgi:hypothetical protein